MWQRLGTALFWFTWPATWLAVRGSSRTRVLIVCGDELLLTKTWLGDGKWSLSGGGLHKGEDPAAGAAREMLEETGVRLAPAALRPLVTTMYHSNGLSYQAHFFVAILPAKPALTLRRLEISAASWLPLAGIGSPDAPKLGIGRDVYRALAAFRAGSDMVQ